MNDEQIRILDDCEKELEKIKEWIKENKFHSNVKFLVSYAVVKSSGSIEVVFKSMIHDFLSTNCIIETNKFLEKHILDSSANPTTGLIESFLEKFDGERKGRFNTLIKGTRQKGELNNLVNLRNDIAHGRDVNSTINNVENYFNSGRFILDKLEEVLNNTIV
ncbi:HEPN domain-containing protein [Gemella sanguinis]|uniref:HEPN domain-containing protein n=1 Tax=Gemella sanguinis TaxID=84135 RepID=UPI00352E7683